jgi:hypothetical protein
MTPTNLHEARKRAGYKSVEALRDKLISSDLLPLAAVPSLSTWARADRAAKKGADPATNGLDPLICLWVADLLDVPYAEVSPIAAEVSERARDLLIRKTRCSSARS